MSRLVNKLKKVYETNPLIHLPIYNFTRGSDYKKSLQFLGESEKWSAEQMNEWQLNQLREIVEYAITYVPFYKQHYKDIGIQSGNDIRDVEDFSKLPFITKADIKENFEKFISDEVGLKYRKFCTSGTQMPLNFYLDEWYNGREQAYFHYYWEKTAQYRVGRDKCIVLRGGGKGTKHFVYNQIYNYKIFDSDYLTNSEALLEYDYEIKKFGAKVVQAYPSSLYMLAKNYQRNDGIKPPRFDVVFLGSENVYQYQLDLIKSIFGVNKIFYHYGHSEQVLLGLKYNECAEYGFMPQYGYCEIVTNDGMNADVGECGELVGTSWSKVMPFIRYRTNDYGVRGDYKDEGYLANAISVKEIIGRRQEFVIRDDNIPVSIVSICGEHMPEMTYFKEMQFEQFVAGELVINVVAYDSCDVEKYQSAIINVMENKFEKHVKCYVKEVDSITKTVAGKNIMLLQHLNISF